MKQIYTLKHFLKIFRTLLPVFYNFILLPVVYSQDTYSLTLSDTSTYDNNGCGKITSSKWTVKNDSCVLYTPYFRKETQGTTIVSYDFRINQSGNGDFNDIAYVQLQREHGGWITDTLIHASNYTSIHNLMGSVSVVYGETIRFRVILETDSKTEFWSVSSGNMTVTGSFETYSGWPPPLNGLPVEMDYFAGSYLNNAIVLKWATFSESNCDYYTIERSTDGKNYEMVAFVDGAGNSNQYLKYAYADEDKIPESKIYYRLKQVDMDGKFEYFGPIAIENNPEKLHITVSPNPVTSFSNILLSFHNEQSQKNQVQVFNSLGCLVINRIVEGVNFMFTLSEPGLYIVVASNDTSVEYNKLTVK
jgi:hypothetical protein